MKSPLRITLVQSNLHWQDIDANLHMFSEKLTGVSDADLIVLPEMFTTGFSMAAEQLAEEMEGKSVQWMRELAKEKNAVVTGSLIIKVPSSSDRAEGEVVWLYYNRLIWMKPDGKYLTYDKRHLFNLSGEEKVYTAGTEKWIVELNGWKICPLICYDLRFPVWSRNAPHPNPPQRGGPTEEGPYDVLLYVANWPERRIQAWKYLLIARAIENQCYTIGLNRVGNDGNDIYHSGDSMAVDALGNIIYHKEHIEDITTIELNYEELHKLRESLPFLKDADSFEINPKAKFKSH